MSKSVLPAIQAVIGDWTYYATTLKLSEVDRLIKDPKEVHEPVNLSDWIQRFKIPKHAEEISKYIREEKQRFLGSIIVGVMGGDPNWMSVQIKVPDDGSLEEEDVDRLEGTLGVLTFSGTEKFFPVDGQHRVAGIKLALKTKGVDPALKDESISAIFIAHGEKPNEKERNRRLFTTLNKKGKPVSAAARVALDEDDGAALVTRRLIEEYWLFKDPKKGYIALDSTGSIPTGNESALTTVVGLYELVKDLYGPFRNFWSMRPKDQEVTDHVVRCAKVFDWLFDNIPEFPQAFKKKGEADLNAGYFRKGTNNHLLFRPIGQRAFFQAIAILRRRGKTDEQALNLLSKAELHVENKAWHEILWDPVASNMITKRAAIAQSQLLRLAGQEPKNALATKNLDAFVASIKANQVQN